MTARGRVGESGYVDLHCHLLPGVDDGPSTMEEALQYARVAVAAGTDLIVATPHIEHVSVPELPQRVAELRDHLRREGIPLRVERGGELKPGSLPLLRHEELELIAHGPPGARWVLFEVPFSGFAEEFHAAAAELRRRGFTPVLAHPERASGFSTRAASEALGLELERGAAVQMNVGPLCGLESGDRAQAAHELLRLRVAPVIATDAHPPGRSYTLTMGLRAALAAGLSEVDARWMTDRGPRALLQHGLRSRHAPAGPRVTARTRFPGPVRGPCPPRADRA